MPTTRAAKARKTKAKTAVAHQITGDTQSEASPANHQAFEDKSPALKLPPELVQHVMRMLPDNESLVSAAMTCRAWHQAEKDSQEVWAYQQAHYAKRNHEALCSSCRGNGFCDIVSESDIELSSPGHEPTYWLYRFKDDGRPCYQCRVPDCQRSCGQLRLLLCGRCISAFARPRESHRLLSKSDAMWRYQLRAKDLEGLPYALTHNPINPSFAPMTLYRRPDVKRAAIARHGSVEAMWAKTKPYLPASQDLWAWLPDLQRKADTYVWHWNTSPK